MRSRTRWQLGLQGVLLTCGLLCGLSTAAAQNDGATTKYRPAEVWYAGEQVAGPQAGKSPAGAEETNKGLARRMLKEARLLAQQGDLDGARRLCRWAMNLNAEWAANEPSPAVVWQELTLLAEQPREWDTRPEAAYEARTRRLPWTADPVLPPDWRPWNPLVDGNSKTHVSVAAQLERAPLEPSRRPPHHDGAQRSLTAPHPPSNSTTDAARKEQVNAADQASANVVAKAPKSADQPRPAVARQPAPPSLASQFFTSLGPLIGFLFGILLCLALLIVALVLLKQLNADGAVFRVELVNTAGPLPVGFNVGNAELADDGGEQELVVPRRRDFDDTPKGVVVDWSVPSDLPIPLEALGPTWDDQRKEEAELKKHKEQAILKHILKTNVELQEQLVETAG